MKLGAFSISLAVKDLKKSQEFYESLGFKVFGGDLEMNYLIMKNEDTLIGLFQGMFDQNILTFNPGWNQNAEALKTYDDVRTIQKELKAKNIELSKEVDEKTSGPANIILVDPDGNQILIDQHIQYGLSGVKQTQLVQHLLKSIFDPEISLELTFRQGISFYSQSSA